jgi:uncharacterized protein (TIGR02466 family)
MIVHQIFPTVVMEFDLSHIANGIKENLDNISLDFHGNHDRVENGTSSFFTNNDILKLPGFTDLKKEFQDCVDAYTKELRLEDAIISNTWFNRMTFGSKTTAHRHPGSVCSGAFYPHAPDGSAGISFRNPLDAFRMNEVFYEPCMYNGTKFTLPSKENTLYLFPSWLEHETEYNHSQDRYVISFNTNPKRG